MTDTAAALTALANGIIPSDARDAGAAAVDAGPRLAERLAAAADPSPYRRGLAAAEELARGKFGRGVAELSEPQAAELLDDLKAQLPAFYRQLREDVCALYLT